MTRYRVLQIRTCRRGDWTSHLFEMRNLPGPWHRIDGTVPDADHLILSLKGAILNAPDLIGEPLVFENGALVAMTQSDKTPRPGTNFTQTFLF